MNKHTHGPVKMVESRIVTVKVDVWVPETDTAPRHWEMQEKTFRVEIDFTAAAKKMGSKAYKNDSGKSIECGGALVVTSTDICEIMPKDEFLDGDQGTKWLNAKAALTKAGL